MQPTSCAPGRGTRGRQIAGRAALVRTGPFPYRQEWKGLVATMEQTLRLHRHQPGTLVCLDRYLHQRTGGMIGSLSHLVRAGAISAILDGSEQLTQELLDAIKLDHAAESATRSGWQPSAAGRFREVHPVPGLVLSDDDYRFCQEFVITAAIRLSEVDFDLDLDGLARDHWLRQRSEAGEAGEAS